jgi:hypothetical protein
VQAYFGGVRYVTLFSGKYRGPDADIV